MIDVADLGAAAERIKTFDVDEGKWPAEAEGFEENAARTLAHLEADLAWRDFSNRHDVEWRLAPDAVRFAIRLGRWTGQSDGLLVEEPPYPAINILMPTPEQVSVVNFLSRDLDGVPPHQVAFAEAVATIDDHLHAHADPGRQKEAADGKLYTARRAARLLLYAADLQAEEYDFDLFRALDLQMGAAQVHTGNPEFEGQVLD